MAIAPGRRSAGAGASARRIGELARTAERTEQHRRAKVTLPLTAAGAVVVGVAAAALLGWELGTVAAVAVLAYGVHRTYRRGRNSWASGAAGEEATARLLAPLARRGYAVLHDRAIPFSRANLDHLVVGVFGAALVDSKNWQSKKSRVTVSGGLLRYGQYDQTKMLRTVVWEAEQAARALGVPVRPIVAIHGAKVPAPRGRLELHGVTVIEAKRLRSMLEGLSPQPGWDAARVTAVEQRAEQHLPPHTG
ncbi:nuclease-related domain-containing protein [Streptomyces mobaraensis]|uniref:NERD domain-containing protein n=1 Tax=Streptomyces mobaraensis TaxID=35621 RepID=A0A5N5VZ47_STRMB|nr:nuclease-related domain-containing protein [Streptomyces mobaraensis]KAB7833538.1 NERD domain-containing protein [Streptomyces mobaraensis]